MSKPVITVENLSKAYRIGDREEIPDTLAGALTGVLRSPWRNFQRLRRLGGLQVGDAGEDVLWALREVSFEVAEGEVIGIIGRNGAGKSTLLKILSRITEPTGGRAVLRGRVSSLLEVGTGFHPELTGRENIYMNGTILGMTKREIDRKFDEIVEFSGVEKFLDTPTKRYSSGMQVRLAFAVAAHLEPEILIIDEVLAVGDVEFQKKCLGKMQDVAASGRTVLFVSHNMAAVCGLCTNAYCLANGRMSSQGDVQTVVADYEHSSQSGSGHQWTGEAGNEHISVTRTWVRSLADDGRFTTTSELEVGVTVRIHKSFHGLIVGFRIYSEFGYPLLYSLFDDHQSSTPEAAKPGEYSHAFVIPPDTLARGRYKIGFEVGQAWVSAAVKDTPGELYIDIENVDGLGLRYPVQRAVGFTSILRPRLTSASCHNL